MGRCIGEAEQHQGRAREVPHGAQVRAELEAAQESAGGGEAEDLNGLPDNGPSRQAAQRSTADWRSSLVVWSVPILPAIARYRHSTPRSPIGSACQAAD